MSQISSMNVQAFVKKWREVIDAINMAGISKINIFGIVLADFSELKIDLTALENHNKHNIELATKTLRDALTMSAEMTRLQAEQETRKLQIDAYWGEICQLRDKLAAKEAEVENISRANAHNIKRGDDHWERITSLEIELERVNKENNSLKMDELRKMNDTQAATIRTLNKRLEAVYTAWEEYEHAASAVGLATSEKIDKIKRIV